MEYSNILLEKKDQIGTITLNRPKKLNSINLEMKKELYHALKELEEDDSIRIVIMTGAGKAFSAGHDNKSPISEMPEFANLKEEKKLFMLDKPTIAAVHGYALGDGLQQALLCDIIIASDDSVLGFIGAQVGGLCYGTFTLLPKVVGRHKANELLFTCEQITAEEGQRIGLVNKVVPRNQLMKTAQGMAQKILQSPALSIKFTKRAMRIALASEEHQNTLKEAWPKILPI
jgi:enoyl-CoA hydratase/carnithine racemase